MPSTAITPKGPRGSRVKLGGSILALVLLENGRQIRGRMNQLSVNGGPLSLLHPLHEGILGAVLVPLRLSLPWPPPKLFSPVAHHGMLPPFSFFCLFRGPPPRPE